MPVPDRHLERHQQYVVDLAESRVHRCEVPPGPGGGIPHEVFEGGDNALRLQPADVRRADHPHQVRVLRDGLLHPSPAHVAYHVENWREALVDAERVHATADLRPDPLQ